MSTISGWKRQVAKYKPKAKTPKVGPGGENPANKPKKAAPKPKPKSKVYPGSVKGRYQSRIEQVQKAVAKKRRS